MQLFEQHGMLDSVIRLVKIAIGKAEDDDPNLVRLFLFLSVMVSVNWTLSFED